MIYLYKILNYFYYILLHIKQVISGKRSTFQNCHLYLVNLQFLYTNSHLYNVANKLFISDIVNLCISDSLIVDINSSINGVY